MPRQLTQAARAASGARSAAIATEIVEIFERDCTDWDTGVILVALGAVIAAIGAQVGLPAVLATIELVATDAITAAEERAERERQDRANDP